MIGQNIIKIESVSEGNQFYFLGTIKLTDLTDSPITLLSEGNTVAEAIHGVKELLVIRLEKHGVL